MPANLLRGELLGVPYMDRFISSEQEQDGLQRLPFAECVGKIEKDIERALQLAARSL